MPGVPGHRSVVANRDPLGAGTLWLVALAARSGNVWGGGKRAKPLGNLWGLLGQVHRFHFGDLVLSDLLSPALALPWS